MNINKWEAFEKEIESKYQNTTGVVVLKDGKVEYEKYFGTCTDKSRMHIFSVTKSIVSILIGIAMDQGYIKSLDQKILDFYPEYPVKRKEKTIQDITIRDMLTMTAPYKYHFFVPYVKYFTSDDWVTFSLNQLGGRGKIGAFQYAPLIGPDILSGILVKTTGKSVLEFAKENLFEPLGISVEKDIQFESKEEQMAFNQATNISGWVRDPQGIHTAGWGLTLSTMDMAKLGQLYLNEGMWNDKRIVSKEWVIASTSEHSRWKKQDLPYGYLWWIDEKGYAAMGDGGNMIYVNTESKTVIAMSALFIPRAGNRLQLVKKFFD